ncbi:regulator of volume decrease after cellular swelling-domain-containing protein [Lasiosphaeria ovina]|uniref:Regulator of volume decrease after cellular swelling-domain-containing protein n=1 Tax=Lasiosphaeria ovina TaxID=92902 RepID=A0AAE0KDU5_9PEZI|nr:regulator of volume decrease after cellular swelling-domain-containing protein [Lasiosphaeria ovina]
MLPSIIHSSPSLGDFKTLSEHLEQTPETFYGGKPVLHYHATGAKAWIPRSQLGHLPFFPADFSSTPTAPESSTLDESSEGTVEQKVDIFVDSRNLTIFCSAAESGLSVPYPLISIHAIKTLGSGDNKFPSLYLQLELSDGGATDDEFETIDLTIIPSTNATTAPTVIGNTDQPPTEVSRLFGAITDCSNLNPDSDDGSSDDDGDRIIFEDGPEIVEGFSGVYMGAGNGDLPPPMPGSGGWITSENVSEFFDEDGNWIGGEGVSGELGDGAGAIHGRDDDEEMANGTNGHDEATDTKRPRTDL